MSGAEEQAPTTPGTHVVVSIEGVQRLAAYLQTRPWGEVNDFLALLSQSPVVAMQPAPEAAATTPTAEPAPHSRAPQARKKRAR